MRRSRRSRRSRGKRRIKRRFRAGKRLKNIFVSRGGIRL